MHVFLSSGYGAILVLWGLVFELLGVAIVAIIYRAIRRDEPQMDRVLPAERSDIARLSGTTSKPRSAVGARR
jgi:hypothetical protein